MIASKQTSFIEVLETSMMCEIPLVGLASLSESQPSLNQQVIHLMGERIKEGQSVIQLLSKDAVGRVSGFLFHLLCSLAKGGLSPSAFRLPLTRREIGNYLGLTMETVSRQLTLLQQRGVILVDRKYISILNVHALAQETDEIANSGVITNPILSAPERRM